MSIYNDYLNAAKKFARLIGKKVIKKYYLLTDNIWSRPSQEKPARSQNILQENIIFRHCKRHWFSESYTLNL
jgi:hypothetical protein